MILRINHHKDMVQVLMLDDFREYTEADWDDTDKVTCFFIKKDNAVELAEKLLSENRKIFLENISKDIKEDLGVKR